MQNNYHPARNESPDARINALELEVVKLRLELDSLTAQRPPLKYAPPDARTVLHETRRYAFEAKLPNVRRVIDFRAHNTATGEALRIDDYSIAQLTHAVRKFARLEAPSRKHWHGKTALYAVARKLFALHSGIVRYERERRWRWSIWPHERREVAERIIQSLAHPQ